MAALSLCVKTRTGQQVLQFTADTSLAQLKSKMSELAQISSDRLKVLMGFPPKPLDLQNGSQTLADLSIRSGDRLIVEESAAQEQPMPPSRPPVTQNNSTSQRGILTRKVVPANNSCLFTSIDFVTEGRSQVELSSAKPMREIIASVVKSDPSTYTDAVLGKSNRSYRDWILSKDSWGGAIEISILSNYYGIEIDIVDTQSGRIDRFGEDRTYSQRVLLIYDGIHYDPLVLESLDPSVPVWSTIFSTSDDNILIQAQEIAEEAKSSRQFTDVASFTLRCLICNTNLKGQTEAEAHAKSTGHINFGEF